MPSRSARERLRQASPALGFSFRRQTLLSAKDDVVEEAPKILFGTELNEGAALDRSKSAKHGFVPVIRIDDYLLPFDHVILLLR
jgi:hypothetical protein